MQITESTIELLRVQYLIALGRFSLLRDSESAVREAARTASRAEVMTFLAESVADEICRQKDEALAEVQYAAIALESAINDYRKIPHSLRT